MAYMIEENARGGTKDLEITYEEMRSFFLQRKRGARIKSVLTSRLNDGAFAASLVSVREKLMDLLTSVTIFHTLEPTQIELLLDHMSNAPFKKGESVFEQNDVGDSFYVILSGEAEVLRDDHPGEEVPETCLTTLEKFQYFGERALLRAEARYAAVRATSDMVCMALTQADCEKALGKPLCEIVPDLLPPSASTH